MSKVCLIDGSGYIFRAFYALPLMTSPEGVPVNAVYGFVTMFMRLLKKIPCDYCLVLLDAHRRNFRNDIFAEYKATRAAPPEQLVPQFPLIRQAIEVMGLPYVEQDGFEADDLIASYTKQSLAENREVVIVTADKDLMQLIRPGVTFYDGMKDKFFTDDDVKAKLGVLPSKVVDVQALAGDSTDNIPGVPGIGLKTAAALVNEFGSLEGVFANTDKVSKPHCRELLKQYKDSAEMSLKLVTLKDDIDLVHDIKEFKCAAPDADKLLAFADSLGFRAIRPKLEKWAAERNGTAAAAAATAEVKKAENVAETEIKTPASEKTAVKPAVAEVRETITTLSQLEELGEKIRQSTVAGLALLSDNYGIGGIGISPQIGESYYLPLAVPDGKKDDLFSFDDGKTLNTSAVVRFLSGLAEDKSVLKVASGLKGLWHGLDKICGRFLDLRPFDDISVMSYDLDSSEHSHALPELSKRFLYADLILPEAPDKKSRLDFMSDEAKDYACKAADCTLQLHGMFKQRIFKEKQTFVYEGLDRPLIPVLLKMEEAGIAVNPGALTALNDSFGGKLSETEKEIYDLAGEKFNLNSPAQTGHILYEVLGLKGKKNKSGSYNTSAEVLENLAEDNKIVAKILEWRMYNKLKSTYTTALLEARDVHDRVHTTFSQTVVNTGRLASSDPNLQNIPVRTETGRQIRGCFEAKKGCLLVAGDYSQMELRLIAAYADVKALKEAFARGDDIHAVTASHVFGIPSEQVDKEHRRRAKAINFGIIYGISQYGLAKQIGVTPAEAKQYIDAYFKIMPEIKKYTEETVQRAHAEGYVETPFGRKCFISGINSPNHRLASFAERAAVNAPIQGGAADIVKRAMVRLEKKLSEEFPEARLLLQVHDELVVEAKEEEAQAVAALMKEVMENTADLSVKFVAEVGIGKNWNEAH